MFVQPSQAIEFRGVRPNDEPPVGKRYLANMHPPFAPRCGRPRHASISPPAPRPELLIAPRCNPARVSVSAIFRLPNRGRRISPRQHRRSQMQPLRRPGRSPRRSGPPLRTRPGAGERTGTRRPKPLVRRDDSEDDPPVGWLHLTRLLTALRPGQCEKHILDGVVRTAPRMSSRAPPRAWQPC